jgi:hypothetical protein
MVSIVALKRDSQYGLPPSRCVALATDHSLSGLNWFRPRTLELDTALSVLAVVFDSVHATSRVKPLPARFWTLTWSASYLSAPISGEERKIVGLTRRIGTNGEFIV